MMRPGPRDAITDVPGLLVGQAHDAALRSGVTVLTARAPFAAAVDVMGGAPGTRETELLAPDRLVPAVDALVLSGGSAFGLDAASGVAEGLRAMGRGFEAAGQRSCSISAMAATRAGRRTPTPRWGARRWRWRGRMSPKAATARAMAPPRPRWRAASAPPRWCWRAGTASARWWR
jgi:D-aminopeptidase